jgi:hypothetical protein
MTTSRRNVIYALGGAGLALIGVGGLFAVTRTPHRALTAWTDIEAAPLADVRLDAFRHAILAPNPHNRQPWQIRLVGDDRALLTCDLARRLPETDPFDRQILIGFGCFMELARIAAAERGIRLDVTPFPEGIPADRLDRRPVASLRFIADPATPKDPLFAIIAVRRTNKRPFDTTRPVGQSALDRLSALGSPAVQVRTSEDTKLIKTLRSQTWDAWMTELETRRTWQESVDLMRIGRAEIEANPDGISIGGPVPEAMALAGQLTRQQIATKGTPAYAGSIDRYRPIMASAVAYTWITTRGNARLDQLATGCSYVRMNLEASRQGLGFHPVSQGLQEFPEMARSLSELHAAIGAQPGERVQMLMRLGYGSEVARTPRWPLQSRLIGT